MRQDRADAARQRSESEARAKAARIELGRELAREGKTTADVIREGWASDPEVFEAWFNERSDRLSSWIAKESVSNLAGAIVGPLAGSLLGAGIKGIAARAGAGILARG